MAYIGSNAYSFGQSISLDLPSVDANSVAEETFTVAGLRADGGPVVVEKRTTNTGLILHAARVSAANTLALTLENVTGSAINAAAQDFYIVQL